MSVSKTHPIEEIVKGDMDTTNMGPNDEGRLDPERAKKFISMVFNESTLNKVVRSVVIKQQIMQIPRMHISEPITEQATENNSSGVVSSPDYSQIELVAKKVRSKFNIPHEFAHENIEQQAFENTLMTAITKKMAEDFERLNIMGDSSITASATAYQRLLKTYDGWFKKSLAGAHIVDAAGSSIYKEMFYAMKRQMPTKYQDPNLRWMLSPNLMTDYAAALSGRATAYGDSIIQMGKDGVLRIAGIEAIEVPLISDDLDVPASAATPAELETLQSEVFVIKTGVNDQLKLKVDGGASQTKTLPEGTWFAGELANRLTDLISGVTVHAVDGFMIFVSQSTGAGSSIEIEAVALSCYTELGIAVGTVTG